MTKKKLKFNHKLRVLNLYSGLGGNRKLWEDVNVTAVEHDPKIAELYSRFYPQDKIVIGDAHQYLISNLDKFDFIWSSPPCQSHSKMSISGRHRKPRYADMKLYEEIILLRQYFKGDWIVENVKPYYEPLIPAQQVGRHLFWSNYEISAEDVKRPKNFINSGTVADKVKLQNWLDIHYDENVYYGKNHDPCQILRNCVHPKLGEQVFNSHKT